MTELFVDTSYVVALVNRKDQYHELANELADKFAAYPLVTTEAVIFEIGNALARNFKAQAIAVIESFFHRMM